MSITKLCNLFQPSTTTNMESIEEKYALHNQLGSYTKIAQVVIGETAGTAGLNIANEQVKVFLTEFIPSIIINVTNIYGPKIGGKLLSDIQMILVNMFTGGFGFNDILNSVINIVGVSSAAMLGFSEHAHAMNAMFTLLDTPIKSYATKLGYVNYIPKAVNLCFNNQHVNTITNTVSTVTNVPITIYKETRAVYLEPFNLLSRWVADQSIQIIVSEVRDPYINNTLIPAFEQFVDELLPKRDLVSNFDPLKTQEEHTLDVTKGAINVRRGQYRRFKRENILIFLLLTFAEELLKNPDVQDYLAVSIGGNKGKKLLDKAREVYEVTDTAINEAYQFANDKYALSNLISQWMRENFTELVTYGANANLAFVQEHAELFKHAFAGHILTKSELDTIKGKWLITQKVEEGIAKAYHFAMHSVSELSSVKSSREIYQDQINEVKNAIALGDDVELAKLFKSYDKNAQFSYKYIILKNKKLNFKSIENGLPITPLMSAIQSGNYKLVQLLVKNCQTKNFKNDESEFIKIDLDEYASGVTALLFAIMKKQTKIAKFLISKGADLIQDSIIGNATPLMLAAKYGNLEITQSLLFYPQVLDNIDAMGYRDRTALHYAMQNKHMDIAAELIKCGADLFLEDASGTTPIGLLYQQLKYENALQTFEALLGNLKSVIEEKIHTLMSQQAPYSLLQPYLQLAVNLDCTLNENNPWFTLLFEHNEIKLIVKLMHSPRNSQCIEDAMWNAVNTDEKKAVSLLMQSMKKLNANEITVKLMEFAPLEVINASLKAFLTTNSLSQVIIDKIIHKNDFYQLDSTILLAIFNQVLMSGDLTSVKYILSKVPKLLDMQDAFLNTPLHHSLKSGHFEVATFLLEQGADITLKNQNNETAYESWAKNNTFLKQVIEKISGIFSPKDALVKAVAFNLHEIHKQMLEFEEELAKTVDKERHQKIYESLRLLILKANNDEVRNEVINKILQNPYCDLGLFSINKGSSYSLLLQTIIKKDEALFRVFIHALLNKYPYQREDICMFFISEVLSATIAESELVKALKIILELPDNENNALLLLTDKKLRLPSEIAFLNKNYQLMEYILNIAPKGITLAMMDYILSKNLLCAEQVFNENQGLIALHLQYESVEKTQLYLQRIWNRYSSHFNSQLFNTYFLHASPNAIDVFLNTQKMLSYFRDYPISMEYFVSKFDDDTLILFINQQFEFLSDTRKFEILHFMLSKGNLMDAIIDIISVNPTLLNMQLPELANNTLLHIAIQKENWVLASYFMMKGSVVNLKNNTGNTAYDDWMRVSSRCTKVEEALVSDSELDIRKALHRRIGNNLIVKCFHAQEIAKPIQKSTNLEEKIQIISERIQMLLIETHVQNGMTLEDYQQIIHDLMIELAREHQIILSSIFSYQLQKSNGNTLLHQAICTRNTNAIDFILKHSVALDLQNNDGNTPLHLAIKNADFDLSRELIECGAAFDIKNREMKTAKQLIESACEKNNSGFALFRVVTLTQEQAAILKQLITPFNTIEPNMNIIVEKRELNVVVESESEVCVKNSLG